MYTYALASLNHPKATQAKVTRYNSLDITKRRASYEVNLKVLWSVELPLYVEVEKKSITVWKPELSPRVSGFFYALYGPRNVYVFHNDGIPICCFN